MALMISSREFFGLLNMKGNSAFQAQGGEHGQASRLFRFPV
jgi:hypothetical protein